MRIRLVYLIALGILVLPFASCIAPPTPIPPTATAIPTSTPTVDFKATEALSIAHVFATLTASAPTPTRTPTITPTSTTTPVPSATPTIDFKATEASIVSHVFATLTASAPKATATVTPTRFRLNMDKIFPPSPARDVLFDNCLACHTFLPLLQQKTPEQWRGTLTNHKNRYVSKLPMPDLESLIIYFGEHFTPDKPLPEPPPEADWRTWPAY